MRAIVKKIVCISSAVAFLAICSPCFGQTAFGVYNSLKGLGFTYEHSVGDKVFNSYTAYADMYGVYTGRTHTPGFKASFSRNKQFLCREFEGSRICLYAGPGVSTGYVYDYEKGNLFDGPDPLVHNQGLVLCATGTFGTRIYLPGRLIIGASMTLEGGIHLRKNETDSGMTTGLYVNGLNRSLYPQVCLMYNFYKPKASAKFDNAAVQTWRKLFRFSVEWGYSACFYQWNHSNYICSEGYRINSIAKGFGFLSNGFVHADVGINATDKLCISLVSGFTGVAGEIYAVPVCIRATGAFKGVSSNGPLLFGEAGVSIPVGNSNKIGEQGSIGGGWRFAQTREISLDLLAGFRLVHQRPYITDADTGKRISDQAVRASDALYVAAFFGLGLNF